MKTFVVDASIVVKWLLNEDGTEEALELKRGSRLIAPELIVAEVANVARKKTIHGGLTTDEFPGFAYALSRLDIELHAMQPLVESAMNLSLQLDHVSYDCFYLALALRSGCRFVTANERLMRKTAGHRDFALRGVCIPLAEAAAPYG